MQGMISAANSNQRKTRGKSDALRLLALPLLQQIRAVARSFGNWQLAPVALLAVGVAWSLGCHQEPDGGALNSGSSTSPPLDPYGGYGYGPVQFLDHPVTNRTVEPDLMDLTFLDTTGKSISLKQYRDKKHLVLVFTRGFSGRLCPYCTTQTSRLISNYAKIAQHNAEVLVVYPGPREHIEEFLQASREQTEQPEQPVPFPILLDPDFKAVDQLGIRGDLASPSTYIIDQQGKVRFAYVGASPGERPSIAALLRELEALAPAGNESAAPQPEASKSTEQ